MLGRTIRAAAAAVLLAGAAQAQPLPLSPFASAGEQQAAMTRRRGHVRGSWCGPTSRASPQLDRAGPQLNAVIALNPHALADARKLDAERKAGHVRGPLHGVPVLLKDNIESDDDTATTAGSLALTDNVTGRDAPLVRRLTDAGAVILGKTNLSEWANFRSTRSISGWSAIGGLVRNPYAPRPHRLRLQRRLRRGRGGGPRHAGHRHRDRRLGHLPGGHQRRRRPEAHRGPGLAHLRRADLGRAGHRPGR